MTTFKLKNSKIIKSDNRITLDAKHNEMISKFKKNKKIKKELEEKLINLEDKYKEEKKREQNLEIKINNIYLEEEIKNLKETINNLNNNEEEKKYYLDTSHILFEYYNTKNQKSKVKNSIGYKDNDKNILNFFNTNKKKTKISDFYEKKNKFQKANLFNKYLNIIDKNFKEESKINNNYNICEVCNIEKTLNQTEGQLICKKCGRVDFIIIDSDKPSYKDPPPEISYFAYKRINHFNEWLAQFQAKESTEIPDEVFNKIMMEIKKERITNMASLNNKKIREYLKKLKLNKYYEHVPHIINRLNGLPPPIIKREIEEKLRIMFKEIQGPFMEVCPKNRKNFLSYSYVLHKFVELLDLDEYKSCFPLLKSREKLHQQDIIWKNICKKLNWHYIKSI